MFIFCIVADLYWLIKCLLVQSFVVAEQTTELVVAEQIAELVVAEQIAELVVAEQMAACGG
jgi:hypothetical protein